MHTKLSFCIEFLIALYRRSLGSLRNSHHKTRFNTHTHLGSDASARTLLIQNTNISSVYVLRTQNVYSKYMVNSACLRVCVSSTRYDRRQMSAIRIQNP
jgi:hypothetical protein